MKNYYKRTWSENCFVICTDVKIESVRDNLSKCKILYSTNSNYKVGTDGLLKSDELVEISEEEALLEII